MAVVDCSGGWLLWWLAAVVVGCGYGCLWRWLAAVVVGCGGCWLLMFCVRSQIPLLLSVAECSIQDTAGSVGEPKRR